MDEVQNWLYSHGEYYLAGFLEQEGASLYRKMGRALRRQLEHCALPAWGEKPLFPAGAYSIWAQGGLFPFHYSFPLPFQFDHRAWEARLRETSEGNLAERLHSLGEALARYPSVPDALPQEFWLGGCGYTHSILHYDRVLHEGLERCAGRLTAGLEGALAAGQAERADLYLALQDLLVGIRAYHGRLLRLLEALPVSQLLDDLLAALQQVPWQPARTFYEGLVCVNFLFYLDGCDSLGRFDQTLGAFYERDLDAGWLDEAQGERLVRGLWENVDASSGWNVALGGTAPGGQSAYNRLTVACLRAARGLRRPNLALRVRRDMPGQVWEAAMDTLASGCGLPALYNEEAYLDAIEKTGLVPDDGERVDFAFGGCTETMLHGRSNVGSLDAGINLLQILSLTLERVLPSAPDFHTLFFAYQADLRSEIERLTGAVSAQQQLKAEYHPQLLRTLLIDDCLERGIEYNAGGARYNWSVINVGGLSNAVDSLAAIREIVFEKHELKGIDFLKALQADFEGYALLRKRLERCPKFGNDDPGVDSLAADLSAFVFGEFARHSPWRGGKFLPGCLMFVTYADAGVQVSATPDGRLAGTPIADSAGPVAGRDRSGPTAMMRSVSRLHWQAAPGTLVVNMRLNPDMLAGAEERRKTRALLETYFQLGNMQIQVNVVDQEILQRAMRDPQAYGDLIVRIGGYSEYFCRLSPELRQTVLERTVHGL